MIKPNSHRNRWLLAACATLLAACAAGPDYQRPATPAVEAYAAGQQPATVGGTRGELAGPQAMTQNAVTAEWWRALGTPKLDELVRQALLNSPTMASAQASLKQAELGMSAFSGSTQLPQVNVRAGALRQGVNGAATGQDSGERQFKLLSASAALSYDLDLAGANQRQLEALAAQVDYQGFQLQAARLNLVTQLALTAISQAQLSAQIRSTQQVIELQEAQLAITLKRLQAGAGTRQELLALQNQIDQLKSGLPALRSRWEQTRHLLAVLAGRPPSDPDMPVFQLADFSLPATLPLNVPSELLRKRPDVRAAEALLQAATAQYGAAEARRYPQLTLSASLGSQALTAASLFGSGSAVWGIGAQLTQPLLNPGLKPAAQAAAAGMEAARANYQYTVLQALRHVADLLRALEADGLAQQSARQAADSASELLRLVGEQYRLGAASYLQLLQAQQSSQLVEQASIDYQARRLANSVAFYQAMGGGMVP